jgi:hypothetical protein
MPLPDNRLRMPVTLIDFVNDVGETGLDHDSWPAPGNQARYDWMRMWFIATLSNQSSFSEPTEFREGTPWFDLNNLTIKIRANDAWVPFSEVISVSEGSDTEETVSLSEWYTATEALLQTTAPEATWGGNCNEDDITTIIVPEAIRSQIDVTKSRPFVWINGLQIDPRDAEYRTTLSVELLNTIKLDTDDRYTVVIKNITSTLFHVPNVDLP